MKDKLISFKTAKLAEEKGFDIFTLFFFDSDKNEGCSSIARSGELIGYTTANGNPDAIFRPTQSLLQKWLREKYNINLWVECVYHDGLNYFCETEIKIFDFFKSLDEYDEWDAKHWIPNFESYEEALEKGLFKFLKLIK